MWQALCLFMRAFPQAWTFIKNPAQQVFAKLWALLRNGCRGAATISYPCLLPFVAALPLEDGGVLSKHMGGKTGFASKLCEEIWEGVTSAELAANQHALLVQAYFECLVHLVLRRQEGESESEAEAEFQATVENLVRPVSWGLEGADTKGGLRQLPSAAASANKQVMGVIAAQLVKLILLHQKLASSSPSPASVLERTWTALWVRVRQIAKACVGKVASELESGSKSNQLGVARVANLVCMVRSQVRDVAGDSKLIEQLDQTATALFTLGVCRAGDIIRADFLQQQQASPSGDGAPASASDGATVDLAMLDLGVYGGMPAAGALLDAAAVVATEFGLQTLTRTVLSSDESGVGALLFWREGGAQQLLPWLEEGCGQTWDWNKDDDGAGFNEKRAARASAMTAKAKDGDGARTCCLMYEQLLLWLRALVQIVQGGSALPAHAKPLFSLLRCQLLTTADDSAPILLQQWSGVIDVISAWCRPAATTAAPAAKTAVWSSHLLVATNLLQCLAKPRPSDTNAAKATSAGAGTPWLPYHDLFDEMVTTVAADVRAPTRADMELRRTFLQQCFGASVPLLVSATALRTIASNCCTALSRGVEGSGGTDGEQERLISALRQLEVVGSLLPVLEASSGGSGGGDAGASSSSSTDPNRVVLFELLFASCALGDPEDDDDTSPTRQVCALLRQSLREQSTTLWRQYADAAAASDSTQFFLTPAELDEFYEKASRRLREMVGSGGDVLEDRWGVQAAELLRLCALTSSTSSVQPVWLLEQLWVGDTAVWQSAVDHFLAKTEDGAAGIKLATLLQCMQQLVDSEGEGGRTMSWRLLFAPDGAPSSPCLCWQVVVAAATMALRSTHCNDGDGCDYASAIYSTPVACAAPSALLGEDNTLASLSLAQRLPSWATRLLVLTVQPASEEETHDAAGKGGAGDSNADGGLDFIRLSVAELLSSSASSLSFSSLQLVPRLATLEAALLVLFEQPGEEIGAARALQLLGSTNAGPDGAENVAALEPLVAQWYQSSTPQKSGAGADSLGVQCPAADAMRIILPHVVNALTHVNGGEEGDRAEGGGGVTKPGRLVKLTTRCVEAAVQCLSTPGDARSVALELVACCCSFEHGGENGGSNGEGSGSDQGRLDGGGLVEAERAALSELVRSVAAVRGTAAAAKTYSRAHHWGMNETLSLTRLLRLSLKQGVGGLMTDAEWGFVVSTGTAGGGGGESRSGVLGALFGGAAGSAEAGGEKAAAESVSPLLLATDKACLLQQLTTAAPSSICTGEGAVWSAKRRGDVLLTVAVELQGELLGLRLHRPAGSRAARADQAQAYLLRRPLRQVLASEQSRLVGSLLHSLPDGEAARRVSDDGLSTFFPSLLGSSDAVRVGCFRLLWRGVEFSIAASNGEAREGKEADMATEMLAADKEGGAGGGDDDDDAEGLSEDNKAEHLQAVAELPLALRFVLEGGGWDEYERLSVLIAASEERAEEDDEDDSDEDSEDSEDDSEDEEHGGGVPSSQSRRSQRRARRVCELRFGLLLSWELLLHRMEVVTAAKPELRAAFSSYIRRCGLLPRVLQLCLDLILNEKGNSTASPSKTPTSPRAGSNAAADDARAHHAAVAAAVLPPLEELSCTSRASMCMLAHHMFFRTVRALPTAVRMWWSDDCDRRSALLIEKHVAATVTPLLLQQEIRCIALARSAEGGGEAGEDDEERELSVRGSRVSREVTASYRRDECTLEMVIRLPPNYPLRMVEVECTNRVGVTEKRWRLWVLQILQLLSSQDGSVLDAVQLWKRNVDKEFEGVEPCPICYCIIETRGHSLPNLECATCHQKFHSRCLYKWFQQSQKNKCPICQQPWSAVGWS
jgi:hypothetical protein